MATRLPPELAGELYCKANVEPMTYMTMNPQIAIELLEKAWILYTNNQLTFSFNYIDKPKENSGYFLKIQGEEMAHDGFQYMDDEVTYPYPKDPRLTVSERSQGFAPGDQYTHIIRRKYTLSQPGRETFALLYYPRAEDNRAVVVDVRRAKTPARQYPLKTIPGVVQAPQPSYQQQQAYRQQQQGFQQQQQQIPPQMKSPQGYNSPKMASPYGAPAAMGGSPASPQQQQGGYGRFAGVPGPVNGPPQGQPQQQQGVPPQRLASLNSNAYGNQRHDAKKLSHNKKQTHPSQQAQMTPQQQAHYIAQQQAMAQAQAQEDAEEPSGDELDFLTAKDVAVARYKRNHDYIAEVFSPYPTSRILPAQVEYKQSIEFLKEQSLKHGDDLDLLKSEHDEKIKRFKGEASVFYKGLEELKQATTSQEVFEANERVEVFKGMSVQPYLAMRPVEMPKDESTRTPELKPRAVAAPPPVEASMPLDTAQLGLDNQVANDVVAAVVGEALVADAAPEVIPQSMEVDSAPSDRVPVAPVVILGESAATVVGTEPAVLNEDTEMGSSGDFMRDMLNSENVTPVAATESTIAQAGTPKDTVMGESPAVTPIQHQEQVPLAQEVDPVQTPIAAAMKPVVSEATHATEMIVEEPDQQQQQQQQVQQQEHAQYHHQHAEAPVMAETFVQSFTSSSVGDGDHMTTTTLTTATTSSTNASGAIVTDSTKNEETTLQYADGHQEQVIEPPTHTHTHTDAQGRTQIEPATAAISDAQHSILPATSSSVTVTELPDSASPVGDNEVVPTPLTAGGSAAFLAQQVQSSTEVTPALSSSALDTPSVTDSADFTPTPAATEAQTPTTPAPPVVPHSATAAPPVAEQQHASSSYQAQQ